MDRAAQTSQTDHQHAAAAAGRGDCACLEERVAALTAELARAREAQARELDERERLARRLALLIESLPGGVVVVDRHGRVAECNPAAQLLLGGDLTGREWRQVVGRAFRPQPDDGHDVSLASGRRVSISTCSLGSEPGQILLLSDVTETRRLQDRLDHLRRLSDIGRMAAAMAHQIRTPIATALLHAGILGREGGTPERRAQVAARLRETLAHMERLVKDMLAFAHTGELEVEELAATALGAGLEAAAAGVCSQRGGRLAVRCAAPGVFVQGNHDALATVIQNLANNAVDAAGPGVAIELALYRRAGELVIEVADDGPGMDAEEAARVFEPFVSSRAGGTGLGLAVVRAILRAHGGRVELDTAPGAGARFIMSLPLLRAEPAAAGGG